jgi:transposase
LRDEIKILGSELEQLTNDHAPRLRQEFGVGAQTAAVLVCVAGDNPDRLKNEASLAALCGVSPLQGSSGKRIAIV